MTIDSDLGVNVLKNSLFKHNSLEIFNADQGSVWMAKYVVWIISS